MPNLLAVSSSPRHGGNSELLLDSFCTGVRDEGWQVEKVHLSKLNFSPCQACDRCADKGQCIVKDGMQEIYPRLLAAQGLVLATPIYFGTVSSQAKMFIDRFQSWWHAKYVLNNPPVAVEEGRKAFFICVGAMENKEYAVNATKVAKIFFHCINYKFAGSLCYRGFDEKGSIKNDPDALKAAYQSGVDFARSYQL